MGIDLPVGIRVLGPLGWLQLEDEANGYWLEAGTLGEKSVSHRKSVASGEYVEGSYAVRSVRENISQPIHVYVEGNTHFQLDARVSKLTDIFDQVQYPLELTLGNLRETWDCETADYVIETSAPYLFSTMALVKATVPRRPRTTKVQTA